VDRSQAQAVGRVALADQAVVRRAVAAGVSRRVAEASHRVEAASHRVAGAAAGRQATITLAVVAGSASRRAGERAVYSR
jgi:hypothetical protein